MGEGNVKSLVSRPQSLIQSDKNSQTPPEKTIEKIKRVLKDEEFRIRRETN